MVAVQENTNLQPYNMMAVPAIARYFVTVHNIEELHQAIAFAKQKSLAISVLGEGSNTLFVGDYAGLIIHNQLDGITLVKETEQSVLLQVAAGENWHQLVEYTVEQVWYGIENLALIPGLVGAAPMQNIGAYGVEIKDVLESVSYVDISSGQIKTLNNAQCQFGYRDSIFKQQLAGKIIITSLVLKLQKSATLTVDYPALKNYFLEQAPNIKDVFNAVCAIRRSKLPAPQDIPNLGSFFKNPIVEMAQYKQLKSRFPDLVAFEVDNNYKLAAAWLIEQAGWKEKDIEGVQVHQQQALVITNPLRATGETVLALANAICADIKQRYDVYLEIEPVRIY